MKRVTIVGGGFAGLSLAFYLEKMGFETSVIEKQERFGGLIDTITLPHGSAETAANALMADQNVEDLFVECGVEFAERGPHIKRRFIYWDQPSRWPLTFKSSLRLARQAFNFMVLGDQCLWPDTGESVHAWAVRVVNEEFAERMLAPALQGIYAGDTRKMSANLIVRSLTQNRPKKGFYKGSVSPVGGMAALMEAMVEELRREGSDLKDQVTFTMPEYITTPLVIATSAWAAADILATSHPAVSTILKQCEPIPLVRMTCFFEPAATDIQGFGCLFPEAQGFHSLGALFDSCIFPDRSSVRSESWIMGGARNPEIGAWSEAQLLEVVEKDRTRLMGSSTAPLSFHIQRWQRAIPHYTTRWEAALKELRVNPPLYLHGNYLGQLGLGRILARSKQLAAEIKENYG